MSEKARSDLVDLLARIPIFQNLTPEECKQLMTVCKKASYSDKRTIYDAGTLGLQLLILLKGKVSIQMSGGSEITMVESTDTVGEMEIASAQPRVASVVASGDVSGLTIDRVDLEGLVRAQPHLGVKIMKNIIDILAGKLAAVDQQLVNKKR